MHIVYIYKDYYPILGGIENHVKVLAEGMAARGHRVTVLVTNTTAHDDITRVGNLTIIKAARLLHMASTPLSLSMIWHALRLPPVDVVHLQFPYPPGDVASLCVPHAPPLVITYQSDIVQQKNILRAYAPLLRHTLQRAAAIIATSPAYAASSPWLRHHQCHIIPLSTDISRFATRDAAQIATVRAQYDAPIVLFVGRLRYYKGLHFLIEARRMMRMPAHVVMVGHGTEDERLQQAAITHGVAHNVHFVGDISDELLPSLYQAATVFVLPSHLRSEAFGIVQLEAQAAGLPIVCTELGTGTSFVTQHGQTGFVVPPANPTALAHALDVLLANPTLATRMGQAGRTRVHTLFTHTHMLNHIEAVYQAVVR